MNREMLKECIADAKTIRESAIANAKLALEEAFTPQLTAMFAERLNELELEESEATKKPVDEYGIEEEITIDETFNLEELLAELEMEEGQDPTMEGEDMEEPVDENLMLEEMSDEEIEELVMKTIEDMIASGKLMAGEESEDEDMDDMDDMEDIEGEEEEEDEDINLEELLAEMDSMEEETSVEEGVFDVVKNIAKKFVGQLTDEQKKNREELIQATERQLKADKLDNGQPITAQSFLTYKEGDGDDLKTQIAKFVDAEKTDAKNTNFKGKFDTRSGSEGGVVLVWKPELSTLQKIATGTSGQTTGGGSGAKAAAFEVELEEAYAAIAELRNELNEINLLNAKLLYTNKIFKAKNLTESEKIKVLNTFDKAETVKEVKLVFETLTESFKATTAKKNPIKESLGSASKTISTATPKQPIIESNEAFARMQKLAGLRK
jgi:hypothetical protein